MTRLRIIAFILVCFQHSAFCQRDTLPRKDYFIYHSKINFHFEDSTYAFTLFVEPTLHETFYFREGFVDSAFYFPPGTHLVSVRMEGKKSFVANDINKPGRDDVLNIKSFFPKLVEYSDSFFVKYYSDGFYPPEEFPPKKMMYEFWFSFLLNNLSEPSLYYCEDKRALRIVFPSESIKKGVGNYTSIRVEFETGKATLFYSEAAFDTAGNPRLLKQESCTIQGKHLQQLEEAIGNIEFGKEDFMTEDWRRNMLIEYRIGDKYYVIRRDEHLEKIFRQLYNELTLLDIYKCFDKHKN